jgi:hypothetical protein
MKALQKAGVVDAGAQGFVYLLEGVVKYVREAARHAPPPLPFQEVQAAIFDKSPEDILFRYCTETLLEGDAIDRDGLRREAALLGDSIVIAGGGSKLRLHIHTNEPEKLFAVAGGFATVAQTKIEDMRAQHESRFDQNRASRVGIVTDSTSDLPPALLEELGIGVVPVRVYFGSENYLDKVTITPSEFYARFAVTDDAPKTSQPPPADFTQVYENVATHAGSIVSVHLSAGLSGTYQAAIVGARPVQKTQDRPRRQPERHGRAGSRRASGRARPRPRERAPTRWRKIAREPAEPVRTFVAVPTLKHLVRGGRVRPLRGFIARMLGLLRS